MTTQTTTESPMKTEDDFYTLTDLLKFTEEFFSMAMIEIDAKQQLVTQRLTAAVKEEAYIYYRDRIRHFRIDEAEREPDSKKRRKIEYATKSLFDIYFNRYVELMGLKKEYDFKESLTFDGSSFDELDKIIQCLKVPGFNREVLAHWMWLVKSSMYYPERLKYHPFMLLLVSQTQGLGKSTFIRELVKPLRPFVSDASIDQITDSRFQYSMMSNYIVVLDEMAKIQKTDINALKRVVTNGSATIRPLFENKIKDVRNNAIFIGMTNKRLIESIYDPTGLRRFVEIEMFEHIDWDLLKEIDFTQAWRSIDESLELGYIDPVLAKVREDQEEFVETDVIDDFVSYYDLNGGGPAKSLISSTELYQLYRNWCTEQCFNFIDHKPWGKKLVALHVERIRRSDGAKYRINSASPIWEKISADGVLKELNIHTATLSSNETPKHYLQ